MITKINELKNSANDSTVKAICDSTIAALSSTIYNGVTPEAKYEIERVSLEHLFEELSKFEKDDVVKEWLSNQKRVYSVKNLGVRKAINTLSLTEGKINPSLMSILERYKEALETTPEVLLYESFIPAMLNFNYIPAITQQVQFIKDAVKKYKIDVEISKIVESMKNTRSSYLLPLIEGVVDNYLNNKNTTTKWQLKNTLLKFSYDDAIRNIINLIDLDATELQLEYANAQCDIKKIYSPIFYLGENEAVFNINGTYYIKKGNNINKFPKENLSSLDNHFITLCEMINDPCVVIENNEIKVYKGSDVAIINESEIKINGKVFTSQQLFDAYEVSKLSGKTEFFNIVNTLHESFNDVAEVDFVKHVYLKEDENHSADIFKLRDNICIATYSKEEGKTTLYRNINPIQAKSVMMEHLRFDVSKAFEDILPNQEKILAEIEETKLSYTNYILTLEAKIEEISMRSSNETMSKVLVALNEELSEVKEEYKDYLNNIQKLTQPIEEGVIITVDVDGKKYTVPIPQETTNGQQTATTAGTQVGAEQLQQKEQPASEVTFDAEDAEALTDAPSIIDDKVNAGAEEAEKKADEVEANKEEEDKEGEEEKKDEDKDKEGEEEKKDVEDVKVNDSDNLEKSPFVKDEEEDEEVNESKKAKKEDKKDKQTKEEKKDKKDNKDKEEKKDIKKGKKKVILKKKSKDNKESKSKKALNENVQISDTVSFEKERGFVIGKMSNGDLIVQLSKNGSTKYAEPSKVKVLGVKSETVKPPFKFDKETQKVLFEQLVRCGIFMNNVPIKTSNCFTMYSEWKDSKPEDAIKVLIENEISMIPRNQVNVFDDPNDFANPDHYVEGVIIDENEEPINSVLINAIDYTEAIGDSEPVRVIIDSKLQSLPKGSLRTIAV